MSVVQHQIALRKLDFSVFSKKIFGQYCVRSGLLKEPKISVVIAVGLNMFLKLTPNFSTYPLRHKF